MNKKKKILFTFISAIVLFFINNILMGSIVPRMPGGSATGITTIFIITFLSLSVSEFGYITLLYSVYGLIGLTSHLLKSDWLYFLIIFLMVVAALIYDWLLSLSRYRLKAHVAVFPLFLIVTQACGLVVSYILNGKGVLYNINIATILYAVLLGYLGIILAYTLFKVVGSKLKYLKH